MNNSMDFSEQDIEMRRIKDAHDMEVRRLQALSVTNIMTDIVPGDGDGLEIYAESVADVERLLSELGDENEALRADLEEAARTLRRYEALHRAKGTPDSLAKADVNAALAARFERTLTRPSK